jgi:deoxycytidine triphosphate deaminase
MYLSHLELEKISEDVFVTPDGDSNPFDKEIQTRVCSVDIRVSDVFWVMKKQRRVIDLSFSATFEISPTRLWKKHNIANNGYIDVKPGEMILGRTHEVIKMPKNLVGKINTRSSYARLGLSTGCNCDLVNPGYVGHVPLELVNCTKNTIRIRPFLPLCQVFLINVDGEIHDDYASERYNSKYNNDDGGPSVWWRDSLVKKVAKNITFTEVGEYSLTEIRNKFDVIDDEGLQRFDKLLNDSNQCSSTSFLEKYQLSEQRKALLYKIRRSLSLWIAPAFTGLGIIQFRAAYDAEGKFTPDTIAIGIWSLVAITIPFFLYYVISKKRKYYGEPDQ